MKKLIILIFALGMTPFITNCSDARFTSVGDDGPSDKVKKDGAVSENDNSDDGEVNDSVDDVVDYANDSGGNHGLCENDPIIRNLRKSCSDLAVALPAPDDSVFEAPASTKQIMSHAGSLNLKDEDGLVIQGQAGKVSIDYVHQLTVFAMSGRLDINMADYILKIQSHAGRLNLKASILKELSSHAGSVRASTYRTDLIKSTAGSKCLGAQSIGRIESSAGSMVILGPTQGRGEIDSIKCQAGKMVIVNMHVKSISNTAGSIVLINSSVDSISGNAGKVFIR